VTRKDQAIIDAERGIAEELKRFTKVTRLRVRGINVFDIGDSSYQVELIVRVRKKNK